MYKPVLITVGVLLILIGAVWTAQGLGYLAGSAMTGVTLWAVVGPVLCLAGLALVVTGIRRRPLR